MVQFYSASFTYDYSLSAVSLAYFLRYPNPYSTHVLSEDVISRHFDPSSQRLYTTRLHLKKSKMPPWLMKLLPKNVLGSCKGPNGEAQNFILEKSVVDMKEGWMETETQNLQLTGVLKVVEQQRYERAAAGTSKDVDAGSSATIRDGSETTNVKTSLSIRSRFGKASTEGQEKQGLLAWSTQRVRRLIEEKTLEKTRIGLINSKEGMSIVLERLRSGGLTAVLEGMRQDRLLVLAGVPGRGAFRHEERSKWKSVWQGRDRNGDNDGDISV